MWTSPLWNWLQKSALTVSRKWVHISCHVSPAPPQNFDAYQVKVLWRDSNIIPNVTSSTTAFNKAPLALKDQVPPDSSSEFMPALTIKLQMIDALCGETSSWYALRTTCLNSESNYIHHFHIHKRVFMRSKYLKLILWRLRCIFTQHLFENMWPLSRDITRR